jgi:hypothetical protein
MIKAILQDGHIVPTEPLPPDWRDGAELSVDLAEEVVPVPALAEGRTMQTQRPDVPWLPKEHMENVRRFPPEELLKYAGKHIAWSWDGTQIVASGDSLEEMEANVIAAGIDPSRVVGDYVDPLG